MGYELPESDRVSLEGLEIEGYTFNIYGARAQFFANMLNIIDSLISYEINIISDALEDKKVGIVGVRQTSDKDIVYAYISKNFRGKGYGQQAIDLLLESIEEGKIHEYDADKDGLVVYKPKQLWYSDNMKKYYV